MAMSFRDKRFAFGVSKEARRKLRIATASREHSEARLAGWVPPCEAKGGDKLPDDFGKMPGALSPKAPKGRR